MSELNLEIDLYHLDESWINLPKLTEEWNTKAVEADIAAMNAKNELEDKKAFLDQRIREFPSEYGITKITEGTVAAEVNAHPDVKSLTQTYFDKLTEHKRLKSKCNSISTVEKSLQGLTKLYEAGYFASKPILATPESISTMKQERETSKLNTENNKSKIMNAKNKLKGK